MPANRCEISGLSAPAIIADRIITAAKNGERDPARLYEQALIPFGIEDMSMPLVSVGGPPRPSLRFGRARSVIIESPVPPTRAFFLYQAEFQQDDFKTPDREQFGLFGARRGRGSFPCL